MQLLLRCLSSQPQHHRLVVQSLLYRLYCSVPSFRLQGDQFLYFSIPLLRHHLSSHLSFLSTYRLLC
jgi:hypothetical protein